MLTIYIYQQLITKINACSHALLFQQDNRFRSASEPEKSSEAKIEYKPDDRRSAPELMQIYPSPDSHYVYPRKLSEPPIPVTLKVLHIYIHRFLQYTTYTYLILNFLLKKIIISNLYVADSSY